MPRGLLMLLAFHSSGTLLNITSNEKSYNLGVSEYYSLDFMYGWMLSEHRKKPYLLPGLGFQYVAEGTRRCS